MQEVELGDHIMMILMTVKMSFQVFPACQAKSTEGSSLVISANKKIKSNLSKVLVISANKKNQIKSIKPNQAKSTEGSSYIR